MSCFRYSKKSKGAFLFSLLEISTPIPHHSLPSLLRSANDWHTGLNRVNEGIEYNGEFGSLENLEMEFESYSWYQKAWILSLPLLCTNWLSLMIHSR